MYSIEDLVWLIPPAILFAILWYFIKLFGKMIDDFSAYSDNRKYSAELNGITYFTVIIAFPVLLLIITIYLMMTYDFVKSVPKWLITWVPPIFSYIIYSIYSTKIRLASIKFFDRDREKQLLDFVIEFLNFIIPNWGSMSEKFIFSPVKFDKIWVYFLFLGVYLSYLSQNIFSMSITFLFTFILLLLIPSNYAMKKFGLLEANIIMKNKKDNILNCKIIRVNDDSIRLKKDSKIYILNRSDVLKIEIIPKPKNLFNAYGN